MQGIPHHDSNEMINCRTGQLGDPVPVGELGGVVLVGGVVGGVVGAELVGCVGGGELEGCVGGAEVGVVGTVFADVVVCCGFVCW